MSEESAWWAIEYELLRDEQVAIGTTFPDLSWFPSGPGHWAGTLPAWPFDRAGPSGLEQYLGEPFSVRLQYGHAFPAAPPAVFPSNPVPAVHLRSFADYHVLGDGSLCLLRDADQWSASSSSIDLLLKASGWRVEYALYLAGKIERLSERGIVLNDGLDFLIVEMLAEARSQ